MLKSDKAKEELRGLLPNLRTSVDGLKRVAGHEIDERIEMWPNLLEKQVEGEARELIGELLDDLYGFMAACTE